MPTAAAATAADSRLLVAALRALGDEARLAIAALLDEGTFNVGELQQVLGLGQSTVSRHLKVLADAGLLEVQRQGRVAWYQWSSALVPSQEALRRFVHAHGRVLDADARQRLHAVFEARAEQTRRFFAGPAAEAISAGRHAFPNVDVLAPLLALVPAGGTVVDVGTGAGRLLGALRSRASRVIGVDASPRMLELAQRRVREAGIDGVSLRLGELSHLPFADGEADAVVAHLVLHHVPQPESALAELRRVLRPGGVLVVGDYLPHAEEAMRQQLADLWLGFDPARFARQLEEAGFTDVSIDRHEGAPGLLGMFVASGFASASRVLPLVPVDREAKDVPGTTGGVVPIREVPVVAAAGVLPSAAPADVRPKRRAALRAESKP